MKKKILIILGVLLVFILICVGVYNLTKPKDLIGKTKIVEGIKFSDAKIKEVDGKYTLLVTVTTTSKKSLNIEDFDATVYDKKGNRLETLTGYIGDIDKNSKKEITIDSNEDLSKAYEINYTVRINND